MPDGREVKLWHHHGREIHADQKGDRMAYIITLEDLHGVIEVIAFPDLYRDHADMIVPEQVVRLTGTVDRGDKAPSCAGPRSNRWPNYRTRGISRVMIRLHDGRRFSTRLPMLRQVFQKYPGSSTVALIMALGGTIEARTSPRPT